MGSGHRNTAPRTERVRAHSRGGLLDRMATMAKAARSAVFARRVRLAAAGTAALVLGACSSLRLGYNNADWLVGYALDGYVTLDDAQQDLLKRRTRELLAWHRAHEMPRVAKLLDEAQRTLAGPVTAEQVLDLQMRLNARIAALGERAAPELAALALTLTPAQVDQFEDKLAAELAKLRREHAVGGRHARDTLEARLKRAVARAETWLGSATPEQRELLRTALAAQPEGAARWLDEREQRNREIVAVVRRIQHEQPAQAVAAQWLREFFVHLAEPPAERRARVAASRRANAELMAQVLNAATPAQRGVLVRKLRGYADDATVLAGAAARG